MDDNFLNDLDKELNKVNSENKATQQNGDDSVVGHNTIIGDHEPETKMFANKKLNIVFTFIAAVSVLAIVGVFIWTKL